MEAIIDSFNTFTEKPVKFLDVQKDAKDDITSLVKNLYDFTKFEEKANGKKKKSDALTALIVEDFDEEQIWQQIELQNSECWDDLVWEVANCMSNKTNLKFPVEIKNDQDEKEESEDEEDDISDMEEETAQHEDEMDEPEINTKKGKSKPKTKIKSSVVDDQFFKLQEMEQFLLKEEKEKKAAPDSDEESIDMFEEDDESDEEGRQEMYNDFFEGGDDYEGENNVEDDDDYEGENNVDDDDYENDDEEVLKKEKLNKKGKKVTFADAMADSDDSDDNEDAGQNETDKNKNEKKSEFEHRQERLQQTINRLEEKMLKEAPWQLKGEVDAAKRPQNSLLEEVVDFDQTSRPPPIITEQTTLTLEDIIRRRIKDKAWDDVEKKEKPVDDQLKFRKTEIIDQSKSKQSLAQVYEAEYLKQKQAASGEKQDEEEPEAHKEIREAMSKLFSKLDALCHYHYTPKAPQAEVKIVSNTPAISMEEVAPVATSEAALLAPEEVKKKRRGDLMSKEERSKTDKNRERRKKKKLQREKGSVPKVTEHRNTKKGVEATDKSLKTSKAFFQQMNDEATSLIKSKRKNKGQ